jgi:DNA-binding MarR family transcriptional regulator
VKKKAPSINEDRPKEVLAPQNLPYQMFLLVQQMTRRFQEILTPHGLTPLHWGILCCLWREDGLRTSEIATRLEQLGGTVTVGLDAMERDSLIERKGDPVDGRVSRIFLAKRGAALEKTLAPSAAALIDDIFRAYSPDEYRQLANHVANLRRTVASPLESPATRRPGPGPD